jgi:hypothetical protein
MIKDKNVLAIQCSDTQSEQYALFCDDKGLYHGSVSEGFRLIAVLENISRLDKPINLDYHFPYVGVTERYGLNAAVANITDKRTFKFVREDYHSDVSSYSFGFLERQGRVLLILQTQWNRLDVIDLETEKLVTEREIVFRKSGKNETDKWGTPKIETKNFIDYFHSSLHISPDCKHFLSNGWAWQPTDYIICFETERFLNEYETCGKDIGYYRGYAWDRPCAFVGNDMIVIAADKDDVKAGEGVDESKLKEPPAYHQLLFYKLSEIKSGEYFYSGYENYDTLPLSYSGRADCDAFSFSADGEITCGEIHFNPETKSLIALSEKGAFELTLEGEVINNAADINLSVDNWAMRYDDERAAKPLEWLKNWRYDAVRHSFYRFNNNEIEKRAFG